MGRLRDRISNTSDSYYVAGEGYRDARKRMKVNRDNFKIMAGVLAVGITLLISGIVSGISKLLYWGGGITAFGGFIGYTIYRQRKNE